MRWRYIRPVCSIFTVFQNLHFDTSEIVNYIFDPPPGGEAVVIYVLFVFALVLFFLASHCFFVFLFFCACVAFPAFLCLCCFSLLLTASVLLLLFRAWFTFPCFFVNPFFPCFCCFLHLLSCLVCFSCCFSWLALFSQLLASVAFGFWLLWPLDFVQVMCN